MVSIIIYGEKKDNRIATALIESLQKYYNIYFSDNKSFLQYGLTNEEKMNIVDTNTIESVDVKNVLIITKKYANLKCLKKILDENLVIVYANNKRAVSRLSDLTENIYTCGYSQKDYVTFSSRDDNEALISLQRALFYPMEGKVIEPTEIACSFNKNIDDYTLLAVVLSYIIIKNKSKNSDEFLDKIKF